MSDEESKFSFSDRTKVDEGDAPEEAVEGADEATVAEVDALVFDEDVVDQTGMLSADELEEAGILGTGEREPEEEVADDPSEEQAAEDSETFGASTMMLDTSEPADEVVERLTEPEPSPPPLPFELVVIAGNQSGVAFPIEGSQLVVGRSRECDIVLEDSSVSRRHFELNRTAAGYVLKDLGSGNGTLIDGDRIDEVALAHGVVVEAGMVRLRWNDPALADTATPIADDDEDEGAKTQVIDLASIEIDPSYVPKPVPAVPAPAASRPVIKAQEHSRSRSKSAHSAPKRSSVTTKQAQPSPKDLMRWLGLGVIGVLAVLGVMSLFESGEAPSRSESAPGAPAATVDSAKAMAEGLEAFKGWRWKEARSHFEKAKESHPDPKAVEEALGRVSQEEAASKIMEAVRSALEAKRYVDAIAQLKQIPDSSVYYGDAKAIIGEATEGIVSEHLKQARDLNAKGKKQAAIAEAEAALRQLPGDAEVQALLRELKDSQPQRAAATRADRKPRQTGSTDRAATRPRPPPTRKVASSGFEPEPEWPTEDEKGTEAKAVLDVGPGLVKYASGKFDEAIGLLDRVMRNTDSDRQRSKAKRLIADIKAFKNLWRTANDHAASERTSDAISTLKRAKTLDRAISGAYRRRIDRVLATQYATQANQAMLAGSHAKAGRLARRALKLSPSQSVARSVMNEVEVKAEGWLATGRSLVNSNPEKAKRLLRQVTEVFPSRDARYIEAYGVLKRIDSEDDD